MAWETCRWRQEQKELRHERPSGTGKVGERAGHGKFGSDKYNASNPPRIFSEDEEAAAKIAQIDAAMLQPLLEHTNAYLTGTLNKPAIDIDELNSLFCSTTGTGTRSTTVPRRRAN